MSSSTARTSADVDLSYGIQEDMPPGPGTVDSQFVFERVPELIADKATEHRAGRVLDVGCGFGGQMDMLRQRGADAWGLDASYDLSWYSRQRFLGDRPATTTCGTAESLPFADGTFDALVCQGSLDHFADPGAFLREAARVLKPDGRAVIAISNYDSLSCRMGRGLYALKERFGRPVYRGRNYWQIPPNHTFRGTYRVLLRLGGAQMDLIECRGASMLWLFHRWSTLLAALPSGASWRMMRALDRVAYRAPALADIVVSVWRPR